MDDSAFREMKTYLHNRKGSKKIFKFGLVLNKGSVEISQHSYKEPKLFHILRKLTDRIEFSYTTALIIPASSEIPIHCKLQHFKQTMKCCLLGFGSNCDFTVENNGSKYGIHLTPILLETTDPLFVLQPCDQTYYTIILYTPVDKQGIPIPNTLSQYECVSSNNTWKLIQYVSGEPAKFVDKKGKPRTIRKHSNEIISVFDGEFSPAQNLLFNMLQEKKPLEGIEEDVGSTDTESSAQPEN